MGKSKRQLADENWLRLNQPDSNNALPGQLSIEGEIAAEAERERTLGAEAPAIGAIPAACPSCSKTLTLLHGWAYSREGPPTIQCPNCAARYSVSPEDHATYRAAVRNAYALLPKAPLSKKKGGGRSRGAR